MGRDSTCDRGQRTVALAPCGCGGTEVPAAIVASPVTRHVRIAEMMIAASNAFAITSATSRRAFSRKVPTSKNRRPTKALLQSGEDPSDGISVKAQARRVGKPSAVCLHDTSAVAGARHSAPWRQPQASCAGVATRVHINVRQHEFALGYIPSRRAATPTITPRATLFPVRRVQCQRSLHQSA